MKFNVVTLGARDYYQVSLALKERDALGLLITDYYLPDFLRKFGKRRFANSLSSRFVFSVYPLAIIAKLLLPWAAANKFRRYVVDYAFGFVAGAVTFLTTNRAVVYSYYLEGFCAFYRLFRRTPDHLICFQVHPTPWFINKIIENDRLKSSQLIDIDFKKDIEDSYSDSEVSNYISCLKMCNGLICASSVTARSVFEGNDFVLPTAIVPYGSKLEEYVDGRGKRSDRKEEKIKIVTVCQLSQRKGMHWAFKAMADSGRGHEFDWVIVSNKVDESIKRLAPDNVVFMSGLSDGQLYDLFLSADLFVLPSLIEGFGLVYIEALSAGTPIVYTENTGPKDFCQNGVNGFEVALSSSNELRDIFASIADGAIELEGMRSGNAVLARSINWESFRKGVSDFVLR